MDDTDFASRLAAVLECDKETVGEFIKGETSLVSSLFVVDRKGDDEREEKMDADGSEVEGKTAALPGGGDGDGDDSSAAGGSAGTALSTGADSHEQKSGDSGGVTEKIFKTEVDLLEERLHGQREPRKKLFVFAVHDDDDDDDDGGGGSTSSDSSGADQEVLDIFNEEESSDGIGRNEYAEACKMYEGKSEMTPVCVGFGIFGKGGRIPFDSCHTLTHSLTHRRRRRQRRHRHRPPLPLQRSRLMEGLERSHINLKYSSVGAEGAIALAVALKANSVVESLNLCNNEIGEQGGKAIASALTSCKSLTFLDLSTNQLGAGAGSALADALRGNKSLRELRLSGNNFRDRTIEALCTSLSKSKNKALEFLDLSHNNIGSRGAAAIGVLLKEKASYAGRLRKLDLSWNKIRDASGLLSGIQAQGLTDLNLSWNGLSDAGGGGVGGPGAAAASGSDEGFGDVSKRLP